MKLNLGYTYILFTIPVGQNDSHYVGVPVVVDAIVTYETVSTKYKASFNSMLSFMNIKDDKNVLGRYNFYLCTALDKKMSQNVNPTEPDYYIVYDEIIDSNLTTLLDATYKSSLNFKLPASTTTMISESELNGYIKDFIDMLSSKGVIVSSDYGDNTNTFVARVDDPNSDIYAELNTLESKLAQAELTIDNINLLNQSAMKTIKELYNLNMSSTISDISEKVESISEKVDIIESNLN